MQAHVPGFVPGVGSSGIVISTWEVEVVILSLIKTGGHHGVACLTRVGGNDTSALPSQGFGASMNWAATEVLLQCSLFDVPSPEMPLQTALPDKCRRRTRAWG